jgi:hypothetical protein
MSVTLSRHPIAVRRQAARLAGSLVVPAQGPRRLVRGARVVPVAVTPPGVVLAKLKLAVHAVLHLIHAVPRRTQVVQALILEVLRTVPVARVSLSKAKGALRGVPSVAEQNAARRSASVRMHPLVGRVADPRAVRDFLALDLIVERLQVVSVRMLIVSAPRVTTALMWPVLIGRPVVDRSEVLTLGATLVPAASHGVQARMPHVVISPRTVDRRTLSSVLSSAGVPTIRVHDVPRGRMPVMLPPGEMRARVPAPV